MAAWLGLRRPSPGELSAPHAHAGVEMTGPCESCHAPGGLTAGCISCHSEIATQLSSGSGYHAVLASQGHTRCAECHSEHNGEGFPLTNKVSWRGQDESTFDHSHVTFKLHGAHSELKCEACHKRENAGTRWPELIAGKPRAKSYVGLNQQCVSCHGDPHGDGMSDDCTSCHDQHKFDPAPGFDHSTVFALTGAHKTTECRACHQMPGRDEVKAGLPAGHPALPFDHVKGKQCASCHDTPHVGRNEKTLYPADCTTCHTTDWFVPHTYTVARHPGSFPLLDAHAKLECKECHRKDGLPDFHGLSPNDCASCHQNPHVAGGRAMALEDTADCARCHSGGTWKIPGAGQRAHIDAGFPLIGAHAAVACATCHVAGRELTGLGKQGCESCHSEQSPHRPAFSLRCESCHRLDDPGWLTVIDGHGGGRAFDVGKAKHAHTSFPLVGAHADVACAKCHDGQHKDLRKESQSCRGCHSSPHQVSFRDRCDDCHKLPALKWEAAARVMTPVQHAETGFRLDLPHNMQKCSDCHSDATHSFAERYPGRKFENCSSCHQSPHGGQFKDVPGDCLTCHAGAHFVPTSFTRADHAKVFALDGPHATVACEGCHKPDPGGGGASPAMIRYRGVPTTCEGCHESPHGGQFVTWPGSCQPCHRGAHFMPASYRLADHTRFPLEGAHRAVPCDACHARDALGVRQFVGVTHACSGCHTTPHGTQFAQQIAEHDCSGCHRTPATWHLPDFDHNTTAWPLTGAHAKAACARCHGIRDPQGMPGIVQFSGTPTACASCHTNVHGEQFADKPDCTSCHKDTTAWSTLDFVHNRDAKFKLDGAHDKLACDACHKKVPGPDNVTRTLYRPLGTACQDCHDAK